MSDYRPPKRHSQRAARLLAIFLPGAGQAYNGRPVVGAWVLVLSPLILPWIWGIWSADQKADRIVGTGGRRGRGGLLWVFFHLWFMINLLLMLLAGLTIAGVLT